MKILALELSSSVGSIAFCGGKESPDFRTFPADRKDSGLFYENLQAIYQHDGPPDLIVVGLGPGSYAGVRISIATALGLGVASGARLRGLPSIYAIEREEYFFVGDARRASFVFAHVIDGRAVEGPSLASAEEVGAKLGALTGVPAVATEPLAQFEELGAGAPARRLVIEHPSALRLIELARRGEGSDEEKLEPIYLRAPYITVPAK